MGRGHHRPRPEPARWSVYHDGRFGYVLLADTKTVVPFDADNAEFRLLMAKYRASVKRTRHSNQVVASLDVTARTNGIQSQVHCLSHFDVERHALYVFNNAQTVYRITPGGVTEVENGTDGVLFVADPKHHTLDVAASRIVRGRPCGHAAGRHSLLAVSAVRVGGVVPDLRVVLQHVLPGAVPNSRDPRRSRPEGLRKDDPVEADRPIGSRVELPADRYQQRPKRS